MSHLLLVPLRGPWWAFLAHHIFRVFDPLPLGLRFRFGTRIIDAFLQASGVCVTIDYRVLGFAVSRVSGFSIRNLHSLVGKVSGGNGCSAGHSIFTFESLDSERALTEVSVVLQLFLWWMALSYFGSIGFD